MIDFPSSPVNGQTFTSNNVTYTWSSAKTQWQASANGFYYIGTTANYFGRASGPQALTGITSIDANSVGVLTGLTVNGNTVIGSTATADRRLKVVGFSTASPINTVQSLGYQSSFEVMNQAQTQNWYFGVNDASSNKLQIGRGYGPAQGVNPSLTVDTSDNFGIYSAPGGYSRLEVTNNGAQNVTWFKNFSGTVSSPTENADWPWPVCALTSYGNFYLQRMLTFTLPNDGHSQGGGVYHTGDDLWSISLNGVTGANSWDNASASTTPATSTTSAVGLQIMGPGNLRLGTINANTIFFRTSNSDRVTIGSAGDVYMSASLGVGTAASGTTGQIRATGSITALYSDKRLKTNIKPITNALDKVNTLNGIYFTQNELAEQYGYNDYSQQVGVFAQDVQKVLPEAIQPAPFDMDENNESKSGENYLTVQYERLVPLLIESIKELNNKIDDLQKEVNMLRGN
jgi:Chaperone of endosialidase